MKTIDDFKNKIICGDCLDVLKTLPDNSIDLIVTDPPYNIGWNYSSLVNDNKKDYHSWCLEWAELCLKKLSNTGVFCIINYPENNNILYTNLINKKVNFVQQLIWSYPTNIGHSKHKYTRSYRTILIFSKTKKNYIFNPKKQNYKNPTDKRIKKLIENGSEGTNHYDIFNINLCKNVSQNKNKNGMNQLPFDLVELLITTYSKPNFIILDPFVGTGTVFNIARLLNRVSVGIDIIPENCDIARKRVASVPTRLFREIKRGLF